MKKFKEYFLEQTEKAKPWQAKKAEVIEFWQNLSPMPIEIEPVPEGHKGTRFRSDGLRITGSPRFINGILSRIKDLIRYESQQGTRLDLEYRQIPPSNLQGVDQTPHYVFYLHVEQDVDKK